MKKNAIVENWNQGVREGWTMYWSPFVSLYKLFKKTFTGK